MSVFILITQNVRFFWLKTLEVIIYSNSIKNSFKSRLPELCRRPVASRYKSSLNFKHK